MAAYHVLSTFRMHLSVAGRFCRTPEDNDQTTNLCKTKNEHNQKKCVKINGKNFFGHFLRTVQILFAREQVLGRSECNHATRAEPAKI